MRSRLILDVLKVCVCVYVSHGLKCVFLPSFFQVIPFPMSCDIRKDCACRDPKAQENIRADSVASLG